MKKYRLVLQWTSLLQSDYDAIVDIESRLIDSLDEEDEVDGHDTGSGEMNIFLNTDRPQKLFEEVKRVLAGDQYLEKMRVAYRRLDGEEYTIIWPLGLKAFSVS